MLDQEEWNGVKAFGAPVKPSSPSGEKEEILLSSPGYANFRVCGIVGVWRSSVGLNTRFLGE